MSYTFSEHKGRKKACRFKDRYTKVLFGKDTLMYSKPDQGCVSFTRETGSSTVCLNGKQQCLMVYSIQIGHLHLLKKITIIYQESLERVRIANDEHIFHWDISATTTLFICTSL